MFVLKNLFRRRIRTLLSIMGVAIGIAAIVAFSAVGDGFKASISTFFRESEAPVVVFSGDVSDIAFSRVTQQDKRTILGIGGVEEVSEVTFFVASAAGLQKRSALPALFLFGRDPSSRLVRKYDNRDLRGRLAQAESEVMLGFLAAESLGKDVGDEIPILGHTCTVTGIFRTGAVWENGGVVVHNAIVKEHLKMGDAFTLGFVYLEDPRQTDRVIGEVRAALGHMAAVRAGEVSEHFSEQLQYIDWFVWVVSLVAVVIGGLGVLNTMLMSVSERIREIGTLRAVGWSREMVIRLILSEGVLISAIGGAFGMLVGVLGAEVIIVFAPKGFLDAVYPFVLFVYGGGIAFVLGLLGSLYPAWQASRLSPVEALKYE
ncbi:MAG: ABC transporter permease [Planctomycetota bacterium]|jgi:putative ABC transport system permease protein